MPSLFSWRPSKLQSRLKKFSDQLAGNEPKSNAQIHSSDDDDAEELQNFDDSTIHNKGFNEVSQDFIVKSSPLKRQASYVRRQQSSLSDDEYFYAQSPAANQTFISPQTQIAIDEAASRRRAVRFMEEQPFLNNRNLQPPICNVAPTSVFSNQNANEPMILVDNEATTPKPSASLQLRAVTSPIPQSMNAAALPPRCSPSPVAKFNDAYNQGQIVGINSRSNNGVSNSTNWQRGFSSMMMVENNSEIETGADSDEHENRQPPRPARSNSTQPGAKKRANILLQQLRSDINLTDSSITQPSTNTPKQQQRSIYNAQRQPNLGMSTETSAVVYLEFNDEIKRSALPAKIYSIEQIKSLFLRTFADLTMEYLNQSYVKIYIQEASKSQLFYELDDLKDIKNHSLLKIREQQQRNFTSPLPIRFIDNPSLSTTFSNLKPEGGATTDYLSEPEIDYAHSRDRFRYHNNKNSYLSRLPGYGYSNRETRDNLRPASVTPGLTGEMVNYQNYRPMLLRSPLIAHQSEFSLRNAISPMTINGDAAKTGNYFQNETLFKKNGSNSMSSTASYDPYYDPYYSSDSASRRSRSGSSTPISMQQQQTLGHVDPIVAEETRQRMDTMERQLVGLSSLVHSALIKRELNPTVRQEMVELQRQILELQTPSVDTFLTLKASTVVEEDDESMNYWNNSSTNAPTNSDNNNCRGMLQTKKETLTQKEELKKAYPDILHNALEEICAELQNFEKIDANFPNLKSVQRSCQKLETLRKTHIEQLKALQNSLRIFELSIEEVRSSVLNSNKKLRMTEVEQLTNSLTQIGKNSAILKKRFPDIQTEVEKEIRQNMENIVKEENFIKEVSQQIDDCLRRCKNLANMMVTMKKLAFIQDPAFKNLNNSGISKKPIMGAAKLTGVATTIQNGPTATTTTTTNEIEKDGNKKDNTQKPNIAINNDATKPHVLDNILDELNFPQSLKKNVSLEAPAGSLSSRTPPKPPERRRYNTTEIRMLYEKDNNVPNRLKLSNNFEGKTMASATDSMESQNGIQKGGTSEFRNETN